MIIGVNLGRFGVPLSAWNAFIHYQITVISLVDPDLSLTLAVTFLKKKIASILILLQQ